MEFIWVLSYIQKSIQALLSVGASSFGGDAMNLTSVL
jgi:hypothetical protein